MPFNPGNQDISGQLMAQGISRFGDELQKGFQSYQQNKMLTAQSTAKFEGALRANPEILQLFTDPNTPTPTDATKAFERLQKDGAVGLKDAAILAQFADSYTDNKRQMQEMAMKKAQAEAADAQRQHAAMLIQQEQAQIDKAAQLQALGQFLNQGRGRDFLPPDAQEQMRQQAADPIQQFAIQTQQATGRAPAPADVRQFLETRMQTSSREEINNLRAQATAEAAALRAQLKEQSEAQKGTQEKFTNAKALREGFYGLAPVKEFQVVDNYFTRAQSFAKDPTGSGDIGLIFSYMKTLDPTSVVREGEYATAANSGSIPQSILNLYNKAKDGEKLQPEQRTNFLESIRKSADVQYQKMRPILEQYDKLAKKAGLDAEDVVSPYYLNWKGATKEEASGKTAPSSGTSGLTDAEEKRRAELRAKIGK